MPERTEQSFYHHYQYDALNRRYAMSHKDGSYWEYGYNKRSELTSGARHQHDESLQAGQQFDYAFDTIGNRSKTKRGGSPTGSELREQRYTANALNQYTTITTPGYLQVAGWANEAATVRFNGAASDRQGEYFRGERSVDNSSGPVYERSIEGNAAASYAGRGGHPLPPPTSLPPTTSTATSPDGRWSCGTAKTAYLNGDPCRDLRPERGRNWTSLTTVRGADSVKQSPPGMYRRQWTGSLTLPVQSEPHAELKSLQTSPFTLHTSYLWGTDLSASPQGAGGWEVCWPCLIPKARLPPIL